MPWPKNSTDLKWFKKHTLNSVVIMGRLTWEDPFMPTPLKDRINVLATNREKSKYPGANKYISGNIVNSIKKQLVRTYNNKDIYIIGGSEIIKQTYELLEEFYLTRIYGNFHCDKKIDLNRIENEMKLYKKIAVNKTCHIEIWKK